MAVFEGVYAAMVTPFADGGGALSPERLRDYCAFLVRRGVNGLFTGGTTGEWPLLGEEERKSEAEAVVAAVRGLPPVAGGPAGGVRVIVHGGAHATGLAARLAVHARLAGADAVSLIGPPYYPLDEEALLEHFCAVAREVQGFPVFLYNIPSLTGNDVTPDLLRRIARRADNVVGLKYSAGDLARFREYRRVMGAGFTLFIGDDGLALPALRAGASGIVSGNASAVPDLAVRLYRLFREGRLPEAARAQAELDGFIAGIDGSAELSSFKAILGWRGVPAGEVRRPLKPLPASGRRALERRIRAMQARGLLED
jgi:4-hydroxy-tetrahydrodipicolinate synthase